MRASEALRPAARALASLLGVGLAVWGVAWLLAVPAWSWRLYRAPLGETLGHRLAGKLSLCRAHGQRSVLFLGASSTREGFDEVLLARLRPGWGFFNAGLAAGSSDTLAVAQVMLRKSGARPGVLVLGLHPFMLRRMDQDLVARGYSDFFDLFDGSEVMGYQKEGDGAQAARLELRLNTLWPPHRHARQLGRRLRAGLELAHRRAWWGAQRPEESFQVAKRDTRPMNEYRFEEVGEGFDPMIARWKRMGFLNPRMYDDPSRADALEALLSSFARQAPALALAVMPEHSYLRARGGLFHSERFWERVERARAAGARVLDYSAAVPDEEFLDLAHLGAAGRERLTRALAADLGPLLGAPQPSGGQP